MSSPSSQPPRKPLVDFASAREPDVVLPFVLEEEDGEINMETL